MTFDLVTPEEIRAASIVTGATMAAFVFSRFFGRHARHIRLAIAAAYFAAVAGFIVYYLL